MLYHPSVNGYQNDEANFDYVEVLIQNNEGIKLKAWLHEKDLINKKTILFFHGNAGNLANRKLNKSERAVKRPVTRGGTFELRIVTVIVATC